MAHATVAAILLGSHKETQVRRAALAALASLCRPVVVSSETEHVRNELAGLPVDLVVSSTVRGGLETALASTPHLDAAVFLRCDQPYVTAGSIRRLLDAFQRSRLPIAAASYENTVGLPALFSRHLFRELVALSSGEDLKRVINEHAPQVIAVP